MNNQINSKSFAGNKGEAFLLKLMTSFNNPVRHGGKRLVVFPVQQVVVQFYKTLTDEL